MKFRVQLVIEGEDTPSIVEEIGAFERGQLRAENLGLTLAEARELLRGLQQAVVAEQTAEFVGRVAAPYDRAMADLLPDTTCEFGADVGALRRKTLWNVS